MARQLNNERKSTPISILKSQKSRMRVYAEKDPNRKGNESDSKVLERILDYYEKSHPVQDNVPKPTYQAKV